MYFYVRVNPRLKVPVYLYIYASVYIVSRSRSRSIYEFHNGEGVLNLYRSRAGWVKGALCA